ncbi:MAG: imidazole glycerol phosphate synthase subunit HisH [Candidatus Micrarchaeota archaeon]|nr:imidazole glycerol phosphate synthase subunit HisH [Candidatus Micrarchaeota archaeon]
MRKPRIQVLSAGYGNMFSVRLALKRAGANVVEQNPDGFVLPGVGAFDTAAANLGPARDALASGKPFLGICLGMQLLFASSSEGSEPGLGVLPGRVKKLAAKKWPHMGWNTVESDGGILLEGVRQPWFYFVHGYACPNTPWTAGVTTCGRRFASVVEKQRVFGVQFHPEKSGSAGRKVLENYLEVVSKWR